MRLMLRRLPLTGFFLRLLLMTHDVLLLNKSTRPKLYASLLSQINTRHDIDTCKSHHYVLRLVIPVVAP